MKFATSATSQFRAAFVKMHRIIKVIEITRDYGS